LPVLIGVGSCVRSYDEEKKFDIVGCWYAVAARYISSGLAMLVRYSR